MAKKTGRNAILYNACISACKDRLFYANSGNEDEKVMQMYGEKIYHYLIYLLDKPLTYAAVKTIVDVKLKTDQKLCTDAMKDLISEILLKEGDTKSTRTKCAEVVDLIERAISISFDKYEIGLFSEKKVHCPICSHEAVEEINTINAVYGVNNYGLKYICPECGTRLKINQLPLGTEADKETIKYRKFTHCYLNKRIKIKGMSASEAYDWLAERMHKNISIGAFSKQDCKQALAIIGNEA